VAGVLELFQRPGYSLFQEGIMFDSQLHRFDRRLSCHAGENILAYMDRAAFKAHVHEHLKPPMLACLQALDSDDDPPCLLLNDKELFFRVRGARDPLALKAATDDLPRLASGLVEAKDKAVKSATLLAPGNSLFPQPPPGQRFGDFRWTPSTLDTGKGPRRCGRRPRGGCQAGAATAIVDQFLRLLAEQAG
jgi:hypothetical protein